MQTSRTWAVSAGVMIASLVLAACQPQTIVQTQVVEVTKEVVQTQVVKETEVVQVEREAFTTPHPILGDLKVRQAIAHCTNKLELVQSVYPLVPADQQAGLVMNTFIPSSSWAYAGDENITIYDFDPAKGAALLDEAGWTLADGATFRANAAGDELSLKFTTTTAAFRQTWAAVFEKQMAACGIRIVRLHAPASWWFGDTTGLARRDFELGAFAWVGQADPGGNSLWSCDQIPSPANNWEGQNYMGWCNQDANAGIKLAVNSLVDAERKAGYTAVQKAYTADVPAIPLFNRTESYAIRSDFVNFKPNPGTSYYSWNAYEWEVPGSDAIVLGFTQEPASLYTLVEDALVAGLTYSLIDGFATTDQGFSYQARMQKELSTIDSGLAVNNDVEVKDGDNVWSTLGEKVALASGVQVKNAAGEVVDFTGGSVQMKQLVVTYNFVDGLTWSDGTPLTKADFELAWKTRCDRESGATTFTICDMVQSVDFASDTSYVVTYLPGVQDPTYFLAPIGWAPAHRVLSDGRTLADVPAKEWPTLPEIAESPIGVGPYMITSWEKGVQMTFEANPHFYLGAPKTPKLIIKFITAENAEAQLLGGEVDVLDGTTLAGISETLSNAANEGKIQVIVEPSATWEHIDFNMFVK